MLDPRPVMRSLLAALVFPILLFAVPARVGSEVAVNQTTNGYQLTSNVSNSIATDQNGNFLVIWSSADSDGSGVYARAFDLARRPRGPEFRVNTFQTSEQSLSTIALTPSGIGVVAWQSLQDGYSYGVYARRIAVDGTFLGPEFRINQTTSGSEEQPAVAIHPNGNFVVVWSRNPGSFGQYHDLYVRRYDAAGNPLTDEAFVDRYTPGPQEHPAIAIQPDGGFVIAWAGYRDGNNYGVLARRFDSAGVPLGPSTIVNTTTAGVQWQPDVAVLPNGGFVVTWLSQGSGMYNTFARVYDGAGVPVTGELTITTNIQTYPKVAPTPDGFMVVAHASGDVFARSFLSNGTVSGADVLMHSPSPGSSNSQHSPSIATVGMHGVVAFSGHVFPAVDDVFATLITLCDPPAAAPVVTAPAEMCANSSASASVPAEYTSYAWNIVNGTFTSGTYAESVSFSAGTTGPVQLSVTAMLPNGCIATKTTSIPVIALTPTVTPSGPTTFCQGGSVTLTAPAGYTYLWSNGATTQSITVDASGSFTVTVTNANGCSGTSAATNVVVNPLPTATITPSGPTTFCEGGSVTLTASAGASWLWSNGATTQSIAVNAGGSYSATVTNANGCSATSAATDVVVNALPSAEITASGPTTFCEGGNVTLTASTGASWLWSNGATTQSITVSASGSYSVTVTNANGCSATSSPASVTVNPLPAATITPSGPTTFCDGGSVTLTASAGESYAWSNGATTQSITVGATGSFTVTVTNTNGCSATSAPTDVVVNALPVAEITASGATTFCEGGSVTLTASAGASWLWSNGATTQSINVAAGGSYSVTVTNANGCSATSAATDVVVNALPVAEITASGATTFCEGGNVTLTASAGTSWLWSNGATTQSIPVAASGSYSVTVTNANGCSSTSSATNVIVNPLPVAEISASGATTFCEGGSVTLTASAGTSWLWSNGATTQSITTGSGGSYSVTVTNENGCSATSTATNVVVNALPTATITPSGATTFCEGGSVTLTASAGTGWLWSNGATTQSITIGSGGSYSVTVTNENGCSATSAATNVIVNALPAATITPSGPTMFCEGGSVTLTASAGTSWLWSNGATTQSITVNASGSHSVTVTNENGCSATSAATNVVVNALPAATITPSGATTFCEGGSVTLSASTGASWLWSNGATTQSITAAASGSYSVTVTNENGCSTTSAATNVTVNALPAATITPSGATTFCEGGNVTLTASVGTSWLWSNGATTQSIAVSASGSYSVTVTNESGCTVTSAATNVIVNALPAATITPSGPTTLCEGGSVTLTASAGTSWFWSNGATTQSIITGTGGSYSVTVTNEHGCSASSAATNVAVNALPAATITPSGPTTFCEGGSVTLTASAGTSWLWSNGATTQSIAVTTAGSYSVTVTNASGCSATSSATTVTVNTLPAATISASGPTTFCAGGSVTLTASTGTSYSWSNGATTQSIYVSDAGSYSVTVTNANGCGAASAPATVTVNEIPAATITASGPTTFCTGGSVTLTASTGASYLWSNGAATQSINVTAAGNYSVTVMSAAGCSATSSATTVTVNALPTATISASGPTMFCAGGSVTLTASAGTSYAWSNGATTQAINVTESGSYTVTVTNANGCSKTSAATAVTVHPLPTPTVTADGPTTFCQGSSVTLTGHGGPGMGTWYRNGVAYSTSYTLTITGPVGTTAYFYRNIENGCIGDSDPVTVTVHPNPATGWSGSGSVCWNGSAWREISGAVAGSTYAWTVTNGSVVSGGTDARVYFSPNAGATSVALDVIVTTPMGCTLTQHMDIPVDRETPSAISASGPTTFCTGGSVTLTMPTAPAGWAYLWSNNATTQSITVSASGTFTARYMKIVGSCYGPPSEPVTVNVTPLPAATITASGPTTFCAGGSITLTASAGASYLWSNGATTPSIDVLSSGSYSVTVTNANGCSATSAATSVTVNAATAIQQQPQSASIPKNTTHTLTVTATGTGTLTYQWYRGTSGNTSNPVSGATSSSYTTAKLSRGTYTYWVRVTGSCGVVNSATATITAN